MVVSALLGWRMLGIIDARLSLLRVSLGALERFLLVLLGLWAGIGWLRLAPLALIMGFVAAHIGYFFKLPDRLA
ncbi:hypothetical protein CCP3SC1_10015 [Gammaproteobacteria bacterium]